MSTKESSLNDLMTQCSRKLIKLTPYEEEKRINEIKNCNHLFVKLRDYDQSSYYPNVDLAVVECVHCGVTNKFKDLEYTLSKYRKSLEYYVLTRFHYVDVEYNESTIESIMINELSNEYISNHLMSNHVLRSSHPSVLYDIAKFLNNDGSNEELFSIMIELNNLESQEEKNKINSIFDAKELIERYLDNIEEKKVFCKK